jgi:hypothetical protein
VLNATVKPRYVVAGLLCLLLFVAAIDQIPDPPAVSPHNSEISRLSIVHVRASSRLRQGVSVVSDSSYSIPKISPSSRQTIENEFLGLDQLHLVRQAADSSPPRLS